ncbi:MAG: hypothetical protein CL473_07595 [Acidobacteria bacterium]|nr:hypothetical protein [Acidobacteriota bacterium]
MIQRVNRTLGRSHWASAVTVVFQVVAPVCMLTCEPTSAEGIVTKHHPTTNVTHCPTHPDSHHSRDSQSPDPLPSCEQTYVGIARTSPGHDVADSSHAQLSVLDQSLVEPDAPSSSFAFTLLTRTFSPSVSPLALNLRL